MKCPKCGYVSFDYNQVCPKCNKDISAEQEKMNLPPFRPVPPSLLGALTGEAGESNVGIQIGSSSGEEVSGEVEESLDVSTDLETEEITLDDSQELDISLEPEAEEDFEQSGELEIGLEESLSDFEFEDADSQEISLDTGEISLDTGEIEINYTSDTEHHGIEILWPGPAIIIRYDKYKTESSDGL